ncbi:MAG: biotin/lipoyl-containing protein [Nitrospinota bacterium]
MRKFSVTHKNVTYEVVVEEAGGPESLRVVVDGVEHLVDVVAEESEGRGAARTPPPRPRPGLSAGQSGEITAPLPGNILKVLVEAGDTVKADTVVCVLEAMKMETRILANQEGAVAEVLVRPGEKVEGGQLLVRLSSSASGAPEE